MRIRSVPVLLLWGLVMPALAADTSPRFPIHAWYSIPAEQTTLEHYRELAECGFTTSFSGFPNADAVAKALDVAGRAGVRLFISLPELSTDPEGTVRRFKAHPALAGYHLRDEPSAADFPALARWTRRIQAVDSGHPCYINLFPTYATAAQLGVATYREHVDRFVKEVPVPFISFDHYPVVGDRLRADFYQNLEIVRDASLAADKPFWAFSQSVAHGPYPVPTPAHLRLQVFSDLAYGAQCIQYFTYWTPVDPHWNFHDAPIDAKGNRTPVYDRVRRMNRQIQALAPVFLGARVIRVGHTEPVPAGAKPFEPSAPLRSLRTAPPGVLVSEFANGPHRYLCIVNRDPGKAAPVQVAFDPAGKVQRVDTGTGEPAAVPDDGYKGALDPGDALVFRFPVPARSAAPETPRR